MTIPYEDMKEAIGHNWYRIDPNLIQTMQRRVAPEDRQWVDDALTEMGAVIGNRIARNAELIDKEPPRLVRWDRDGEATNEVVHSAAALDSKRTLWKHNLIHLLDSEEAASRGRPIPPIAHIAYFYLLSQCDTGMLCSMGMTSAVIRLVDRYASEEAKKRFLPKLLTADYDEGYSGSMYLTESAGGSDLGLLETVATREGDTWRLNGFKWFCSNVDGDVIVALARPEGAPNGTRGLGLFAVPARLDDGSPNGIQIRRIKNKLGTRSVPTGEVDFVDALAYPLARDGSPDDGRGINRMMEFVNQSRIAVAAMGAGIMRRVFLEAAIRTTARKAFGGPLNAQPMVREQLIDLMCESEAAAALLFESASRNTAEGAVDGGDKLARILAPLSKMRCTEGGIQSASSALELFGGNGYIENYPMARQLRDAQCHTLWEGTQNVLALDVLRTIAKNNAHEAILDRVAGCLDCATHPALASTRDRIGREVGRLIEDLSRLAGAGPDVTMLHARHLADEMADVVQCALVVEEAQWELDHEGSARKAIVAAWLAKKRFEPRRSWTVAHETIVKDFFARLTRYEPVSIEDAESVFA